MNLKVATGSSNMKKRKKTWERIYNFYSSVDPVELRSSKNILDAESESDFFI